MIRLSGSVKLYWSPGWGLGVGALGGWPPPFSARCALAAHGAVFAGVGQNFRAIGSHGELAELEHFELLGQLQDFDEALGEQRWVFPAKGAKGVVVGMGVGGEQAHRDAIVSALLDATAAEGARGIAVNEQPEQH